MSDNIWTGIITSSCSMIDYSDWYWGDADCKTRCRDKITHRQFSVCPPLPQNIDDTKYIVKTDDGEDVVCYSDGHLLIELNPKVETETRYIVTFKDKLKALFSK